MNTASHTAIASTVASTLTLTEQWQLEGSSTKMESLIVEAENALLDASNVIEVLSIADSGLSSTIGFAVITSDIGRHFYLAADGDVLSFDAEGKLLAP